MSELVLFLKLFFHCFILFSVKSVIVCLAFSCTVLELVFKCTVRMAFTLPIVGFYDQYVISLTIVLYPSVLIIVSSRMAALQPF